MVIDTKTPSYPSFRVSARSSQIESPPFLPLLVTAFTSILEVSLLCFAGYILAKHGMLDRKLQKQLNHLNIVLFTPALLVSKIAFSLSPEKIQELWILPIFFVVITGTSMAVAFILGRMFGLRPSQRRFAMAATMFMSSNSLPVAFIQSILISGTNLHWGPHDNKNAMLGRALTYLIFYTVLSMILRWSYGVTLFQVDKHELDNIEDLDETGTPLLSSSDQDRSEEGSNTDAEAEAGLYYRRRRGLSDPPIRVNAEIAHSFKVSHTWATIGNIMTPPLWASLLSLFIACVPPIQQGIERYMPPLTTALASAGKCSIPLTLVVLGAYFHPGNEIVSEEATRKKETMLPGETKTVVVAVLSRMIITPILLVPLLALSIKFSSQRVLEDPVFVISMILLIASPVALTLVQITQTASGNTFERLISRTMFWSYCVATPPVTVFYIVLGLLFIQERVMTIFDPATTVAS